MKGSFLFVKPSDPEGKHGTSYSGESPTYPYDHTSWEWLLERALRRTLIPWALTKSHSRELLSGHEDQYSMHRWGSYGESYDAGSTPPEYKAVGGPGAYNRKTDADLSRNDREKSLPKSWGSSKETPVVSSATKITYGVADLEETVANLPFSLEWLHPGWSPSALDAWDLTASTTETTQYLGPDSNGDEWWRTTVDHTPYEIPKDYPFKCLSHMRTDDPTVKVNITNDDNEDIEVETAPTPVSAPRTTDGSIYEYNGTLVRSASHGAAYKAGWTLSEFYIQYRDGLDYSESTGGAYDRGNKTFEDKNTGSNSTIGCLVDIPDKDSGNRNIVVWQDSHDYHTWTGFAHEVDWGGKQTWWHANNFPKGLDSVLSPKLRTQLNTLCPECQPAIPPTVPAFENGFPDAESLPWKHSSHAMYPQAWIRHLALACTPFDMSARLDAMTTTVHRVPKLFAKIKMVTTIYKTSRSDGTGTDSDGSVQQSWRVSTSRRVETVEGTSPDPIIAVDPFNSATIIPVSVSGQGGCVMHSRETEIDPDSGGISRSWNDKTQHTWEESCKSNSDFIVCLRSTANTTLSTKVTTKTYTTEESSSSDPSSTEREESDGNLPDSYDPDPDDLLFPDWVLPWIESAELFAAIESRLGRMNDADSTVVNEYRPTTFAHLEEWELISTHTMGGSGTRTHEAHRKIVSLGSMDTSTGRFPAIDAAAILSKVDPDPTEPTEYVTDNVYGDTPNSCDITATITTEDGNKTKKETVVTKANNDNNRSRSVSYYVVVKWKFDRDDPETLQAESPLADLYRKLADARKALADAEDALDDADDSLDAADAALVSARAARASAQAAYENPEDAEPALRAEAQAALDDAETALNTAKSETTDAQTAYATAEDVLQTAENNLQEAQAAYDAAVEAGDGVEEAEAALETAYAANYEATKAYGKASGRLANAEVDEAVAQAAYDAAEYYYDTLDDNLESILLKAYNDAKAAFDKATAKYDEWTQKVAEAQEAVEDLEDAVAAAEQAIRDAGGVVP